MDLELDAKTLEDIEIGIKVSQVKSETEIAPNEDMDTRIVPGDVENVIKIARTGSNAEVAPNEDVDARIAHVDAMIPPRDIEFGIEITPVESNSKVASNENVDLRIFPEDLDVQMACVTLFEPPILEVNIQYPSRRSNIQKVPFLLLQNPNFARYCTPKMISFGPIHHRRQNDDLQLGQQFKYLWAIHYIEQYARSKGIGDNDFAKRFLYGTVIQNLPELRNLFNKDVTKDYNDGELAHMLFVDGCALLYFMDNFNDEESELLILKLDQLLYIWIDIILLENQLPTMLLKLLIVDSEFQLDNLLFNFLFMGLPKKKKELTVIPQRQHGRESTHLLDYIRSYYCYTDESQHEVKFSSCLHHICLSLFPGMVVSSAIKKTFGSLLDMVVSSVIKEAFRSLREADYWHRYKNIGDLRKAGIRVKPSQAEWKWGNVSFTSNCFSGQLMLPGIVVDDVALYLYHNLIAYEMCPDFQNNFEFCSYFSLMDSFIDDAEDVKELRAAGVLQNLLGSDEEVAKLFNELGHVLPSKLFNAYSYCNRYVAVKRQIDEHYRKKWKTWLAELRSTYFNTPWSHITFYAAVLALALTFIQTWYAINPKK